MKKSMASAYTDMMNNLAKSTAAIPLHLQGAKGALAWWEQPDSLLAKSEIAPAEELAKASAENETDEAYEEDEEKDKEKKESEKEDDSDEKDEEHDEDPEPAEEGMKKATPADDIRRMLKDPKPYILKTDNSKKSKDSPSAPSEPAHKPKVTSPMDDRTGLVPKPYDLKKALTDLNEIADGMLTKAGPAGTTPVNPISTTPKKLGPLAQIKADNARKAALVYEAADIVRGMNQTFRTKVLGEAPKSSGQ